MRQNSPNSRANSLRPMG